MFATRDIQAGELIHAGRPLMVNTHLARSLYVQKIPKWFDKWQTWKVSFFEAERMFKIAYDRMKEKDQEAFLALFNAHTEDRSGLLHGIARTNSFGTSMLDDGGEFEFVFLSNPGSFKLKRC